MRSTIVAVGIALVSCIVRLVDNHWHWLVLDPTTYWSIAAILIGLIVTAGMATKRGSRAARIYLFAWSIPVAFGVARTAWALGLIGGMSTLIAMSLLFFMAIEAFASALAVSWPVGGLRGQRDEARAMQAQLQRMADIDSLTGLLNRRAFVERALSGRARSLCKRVIVVDIDHFKFVNDRYGHQAGDDVLAAVGRAISMTAPPHGSWVDSAVKNSGSLSRVTSTTACPSGCAQPLRQRGRKMAIR